MTNEQRKQQSKQAEGLARRSHFSLAEVEGLLALYRRLASANKSGPAGGTSVGGGSTSAAASLSVAAAQERLDRTRFREFLHNAFDMTDDILLDRIFKRFDADNDGYVGREEWIMGLSTFLKGGYDERVRYCFEIYDLNSDGFITREEMLNMLKTSLGRQGLDEDQDEGVKDLIEMTLRKMDRDKDGRISLNDWTQTIEKEPLLLEAFGPCLPHQKAAELFIEKSRDLD